MEDRVAALDWQGIEASLNAGGHAIIPALLSPRDCESLIATYDDEAKFRSRIVMARHNFGRGEYQYFNYPLPRIVADLRTALYSPLATIANSWNKSLNDDVRYPQSLDAFLNRCHRAGQVRPTPLLLRYGADDYNCLHQDLYGEHVFPLQ